MSFQPASASSGDLLADRRYLHAKAAFDDADWAAAAELAEQALERAPDFAAALALLGRARLRQGEREAAGVALSAALALAPDDPLGLRIDLAQLGAIAPAAAITAPYVKALFDDYAPRFDRHLVRNLDYRGPELIADALRRAASLRLRSPRFTRGFDLGCGTGLMARALAGVVAVLEGVDLSPRMLDRARKTRLYAALYEGDLSAFLAGRRDEEADLVVAADVFVYLADLSAVFYEAHRVLSRSGFLAFTVQAHSGDGVILGEDGRYCHGESYLHDFAAAHGFRTVLFEPVSTRQDRGEHVPGFLAVLER